MRTNTTKIEWNDWKYWREEKKTNFMVKKTDGIYTQKCDCKTIQWKFVENLKLIFFALWFSMT